MKKSIQKRLIDYRLLLNRLENNKDFYCPEDYYKAEKALKSLKVGVSKWDPTKNSPKPNDWALWAISHK